jgi:hypothetical protein
MSTYSAAIAKFAKKHGPTGDTKYDIFDQSGMTRAQDAQERATKKVRRLRPGSNKRTQGGEIV